VSNTKDQNTKPAYPLSFTGAALLSSESATLARLFLDLGSWDEVYREVDANELLNRSKTATRRRLFNELSLRLRSLADVELQLLIEGNAETQRLILWQAVCRTYPFVGNFTLEVLQPKIQLYDDQLLNSDYRNYFWEQAILFPRLDELTPSTKQKMESRLYYMMEQAGLIDSTETRRIIQPFISELLCTRVRAQDPHYLSFWLLATENV
jgi:hypothetical protein